MRIKKLAAGGVLLCILCVFGFLFYERLSDYWESEAEYEALQDTFLRDLSEDDAEDVVVHGFEERGPVVPDVFPDMEVDHEGLSEKNPDYVAWLYYADGDISLPVVQEPEGQFGYYLHRTFDDKASKAGCVYAGSEIPLDSGRGNIFLFGHNMADGSMFGGLKYLYRGKKEITDPYFYLFMKDGMKRQFRIVSMHVVHSEDYTFYDSPATAEAYEDYMERVLASDEMGLLEKFPLSDYEQDCIDMHSQIVTLYVCYGASGTSWRLYVQGVETYVSRS